MGFVSLLIIDFSLYKLINIKLSLFIICDNGYRLDTLEYNKNFFLFSIEKSIIYESPWITHSEYWEYICCFVMYFFLSKPVPRIGLTLTSLCQQCWFLDVREPSATTSSHWSLITQHQQLKYLNIPRGTQDYYFYYTET